MAADTLTNDIILEILARVPDAPALLRCAATCRWWRALVADPSFLRRRWPDPTYSLLGSFVPKELKLNGGDDASFLPGPTPRSALAAGRRLLSSFVTDAAGLPADYVCPLTSHGGLVLLTVLNYSPGQIGGVPLAVCSLLAGTCDVLPPLERYMYWAGHAVLTSADYKGGAVLTSAGCRPSFKVLMMVATDLDKETDYDLHTLVAGQPSWNAPTKCIRRAALGILMHSDAVVCQGAAHWLFCASSSFHVLHVDAETGRVSSTKLTSPMSPRPLVDRADLIAKRGRTRLATTTDGKLLSLCLYDAGLQLMEIWTQPAAAGHGQDCRWTRTGVIDLKLKLKAMLEQPQRVPYVWLGGRCGNGKLLIVLAHRHGYIVNLQTGTMQEVDNISSSGFISKNVVCMEIDWTTFFMARLACTTQP
ncbi:hypothetical protein D1007_25311 [Hordeum vulgare]|nr:hypothetical protein D1007_25311 [Hordeum vulgare]KAI4976433.1 hypothetical protein ZWY2020_050040 [Hordeum vulgare]